MEIRFGLISADSHAAFSRDDFTSRMSASKWGDRIPHVAESERDGIYSILVSEGVRQRLRGDLRCSINRDRLRVFSLDTQGARLAIRPIGHDR